MRKLRISSLVAASFSLIVAGLLCCPLSTEAQTQQNDATPRLNAIPKTSNTLEIGPGDLIEVDVFNTPELSGKQQVSETGKLRIASVSDISVDGMTAAEAAAEIERRLKSAEVMLNPHVTVLIQEHATRQVSVLGEVNRPGTYALQGWPSLANALATAGGGTPKQGSTITIVHRSDPEHPVLVRVDGTSADSRQAGIILQTSDVVTVSEAGLIYVVGDVTRPGQFPMTHGRPLTALEALALAEGLKDNSRPEKAAIIRVHGSSAERIPVNLARVQKSQVGDVALEPSDILVIPHSGYKQFQTNVLPSLTGAAANALALALIGR